jgi:uncharacterized YccA/Bax inhibitor family protein
MALFKSSNPALNSETFDKVEKATDADGTMTLQGTVNKTGLLGLIVFASALYTWNMYQRSLNFEQIQSYVLIGSVSAFVVALVLIFNKPWSPYLAPLYCLLEGLALGGLSAFMDERFPGIVLQAIMLTFGILFSLLFIYRLGLIRATENFKLIVASATAGIAIFYLISLIGSFFNFHVPLIHDNGIWGIVFSLFVVVIAALNLVVDFDFIEQGAASNAPKYMEWYSAFGLMVTIIWLYLEILRLLSKVRKK